MDDIYKNIEEHNPNPKLIEFDDMVTDVLRNKKLYPSVTELFIRGRKTDTSLIFLHNLILLSQKIPD